ncbi:M48 family metalloprotease [Candidatus Poribacteria bacterium]|nr:M48 family metalloprotease [Candidatus Poribacteria bacterium]
MKRLPVVLVFLIALSLAATACETTGMNVGQINFVSPEEEIRLGKNVAAEVEKKERVLQNPALTAYVDEIGRRIVAQTERPGIPYTFKVIDNDKDVNAFSLPGGPVYVNTALLKYADNEAELAAVIGHEVAHVVARHATEQMTKAFGLELLAEIALGNNPNAAAQMGADIAGSLGMLKFSRNDELEADRLGLRYMFEAGYSPNAMTTFLEKLGNLEKEHPSRVATLFSSHPVSQQRVDALRREISMLPPGRSVGYYAERYREIIDRELK